LRGHFEAEEREGKGKEGRRKEKEEKNKGRERTFLEINFRLPPGPDHGPSGP